MLIFYLILFLVKFNSSDNFILISFNSSYYYCLFDSSNFTYLVIVFSLVLITKYHAESFDLQNIVPAYLPPNHSYEFILINVSSFFIFTSNLS